jgi:hypothetical protein
MAGVSRRGAGVAETVEVGDLEWPRRTGGCSRPEAKRPHGRKTMGASVSCQADASLVLVAPAGVEPTTRGLGNRCSIRLSYGATTREVSMA